MYAVLHNSDIITLIIFSYLCCMAAPKGHEKWGNPLNPKKYTPETLWDEAVLYFKHCDSTPWIKQEAIKSGDLAGTTMDVPTQKPYTKQGLCVFLNISFQTLKNYENAEGYETFFEVVEHITSIIEQNQLEGATVGAYNSSIISRLLGLIDKQDIDQKIKINDKINLSINFKDFSDEE